MSATDEEDASEANFAHEAPEQDNPPHPAGAAYSKVGHNYPLDGVRTKWTGTLFGHDVRPGLSTKAVVREATKNRRQASGMQPLRFSMGDNLTG